MCYCWCRFVCGFVSNLLRGRARRGCRRRGFTPALPASLPQEIANKTADETARQAGVTKLAAPRPEENARGCSQNHTRNGAPAQRKTASAATPSGTTTQEIASKNTYETARQAGVKPRRRQPRRARPRKRLPTKPHTKRRAVNKRTVHPVNKRTLHRVNKRTRCT